MFKYHLYFLCILQCCYYNSFGQSYGVSLPIEKITSLPYEQTLDGESFKTSDFIAVSLRLEGYQIRQLPIRYFLQTPEKTYEFVFAHEYSNDSEDIFVSDIVYLNPSERGSWSFKIQCDDNFPIQELQASGFLRVFIPTSNFQTDQSTSNRLIEPDNNCLCPLPAYIARTNWGISYGLSANIYIAPAIYTNVTHLIVHHSAGTNVSSNWKGVVASIFDSHVFTNGWQDIGYNWLIDPNGVLYEGRGGGDNVVGAHMCGYNSNTMGVCMLGNFEIKEPNSKMLNMLNELLSFKACKENIVADGVGNIAAYPETMFHISGHKDGCAPNYTFCPGKFLYEKMKEIRIRAKDYVTTVCQEISAIESLEAKKFSIYPVPSDEILCVKDGHCVRILNIHGIEMPMILSNSEDCYNISSFPSGMYFAVGMATNQYTTAKFFKH